MKTVFMKYHGTAYFRVESDEDRQKVQDAYEMAFAEIARSLAPNIKLVVEDHDFTTTTY